MHTPALGIPSWFSLECIRARDSIFCDFMLVVYSKRQRSLTRTGISGYRHHRLGQRAS